MRTVIILALFAWTVTALAAAATPPLTVNPVDATSPVPVITLTGTASPFATIAVTVNERPQGVFQAEEDGKFSRAVALDKGDNVIALTAVEELPVGAVGIVSTYNQQKADVFGLGSGFRGHIVEKGIRAARLEYMNPSSVMHSGNTYGPAGAHILEMRLRNTTPIGAVKLLLKYGSTRNSIDGGTHEVKLPVRCEDFEIVTFDLAKLAGINPADGQFNWQLHFYGSERVDDPEHYGRGAVRGSNEWVEVDYIKLYGVTDPAAMILPWVNVTVHSTAAPLAHTLDTLEHRIAAARTKATDMLAWARCFDLVDRARLAYLASDMKTANTLLSEAADTVKAAGL
jgi:hypothetical protein